MTIKKENIKKYGVKVLAYIVITVGTVAVTIAEISRNHLENICFVTKLDNLFGFGDYRHQIGEIQEEYQAIVDAEGRQAEVETNFYKQVDNKTYKYACNKKGFKIAEVEVDHPIYDEFGNAEYFETVITYENGEEKVIPLILKKSK